MSSKIELSKRPYDFNTDCFWHERPDRATPQRVPRQRDEWGLEPPVLHDGTLFVRGAVGPEVTEDMHAADIVADEVVRAALGVRDLMRAAGIERSPTSRIQTRQASDGGLRFVVEPDGEEQDGGPDEFRMLMRAAREWGGTSTRP